MAVCSQGHSRGNPKAQLYRAGLLQQKIQSSHLRQQLPRAARGLHHHITPHRHIRKRSKHTRQRIDLTKSTNVENMASVGKPRTSSTTISFFGLFPTSLCGVLVFGCALPPAPAVLHDTRPPDPPTHNLLLTHNLTTHKLTHNLLTHNLSTHNLLTHTTYSHKLTHTHTTCPHTTYSHTTYSRKLTHTHTACPHTTYSHTTYSHTHNLSTHNLSPHNLLTHNMFTTQLAHTQLDHTQTHTHTHNLLTHNLSTHNLLTHNFLTHTNLLTHLATSTVTLRGRRGTW